MYYFNFSVNVDRMLPDSFDARIKWPGLIHDILDQGDCGASWAFSTAGEYVCLKIWVCMFVLTF